MKAVFTDDRCCVLHICHPARAVDPNTDVRRTHEQHAPIHVSEIRDDYENVAKLDWLELGGFA